MCKTFRTESLSLRFAESWFSDVRDERPRTSENQATSPHPPPPKKKKTKKTKNKKRLILRLEKSEMEISFSELSQIKKKNFFRDVLAIFGLKNSQHITCKCSKIFSFYFRFLATKFTGRTGLKTVLNRCFGMGSMGLSVDIKKAIQLVSGAACAWINLVPRALFLPLLHLKGKSGLGTS